ncbi:hypothetical protein [Phaeovulum sp.]|uniref:hypothetical protein n=1 Tax=Phaeovulum sp. TaxID=2934796 RepID=UPI0039E53AD6
MFRPALAPSTALVVCALLVACTTQPQTADAPYPSLLPLDSILVEAEPPIDPTDSLDARATDLRARATGLRGPVIPPDSMPGT